MNQTLGGALQGLGKVYVPAISLAIGAIIKLLSNLALIPNAGIGVFGGINGAAISSVMASGIAMSINLIVLRNTIKLDMDTVQTIVKPLIATLLMGIAANFSYLFANNYFGNAISTIIAICVAVVVYLLLVLMLKILDREDYHMLPYGDKIYNALAKFKLQKP